MKKVIFTVLALGAFGAVCLPVYAGDTETKVNGDTAIIQSVDMTVDQYGTNNQAIQQGQVRNRSYGYPQGGSTGIVQTGNVTTIQTGDRNVGRSKFRIENETGTPPTRQRR